MDESFFFVFLYPLNINFKLNRILSPYLEMNRLSVFICVKFQYEKTLTTSYSRRGPPNYHRRELRSTLTGESLRQLRRSGAHVPSTLRSVPPRFLDLLGPRASRLLLIGLLFRFLVPASISRRADLRSLVVGGNKKKPLPTFCQ